MQPERTPTEPRPTLGYESPRDDAPVLLTRAPWDVQLARGGALLAAIAAAYVLFRAWGQYTAIVQSADFDTWPRTPYVVAGGLALLGGVVGWAAILIRPAGAAPVRQAWTAIALAAGAMLVF